MPTYISSKYVAVTLVIIFLALFLLQRFEVGGIYARGSANSAGINAPDQEIPVNPDYFSVEGM